MAKEYDIVFLGGGPAGYVGAIRAVQLGLSAAVVEATNLGGTCLHKGCIPTKALLKSAEKYRDVKKMAHFGVDIVSAQFSLSRAMTRKNMIVGQLTKGIEGLIKKARIDVYKGIGHILGPSIFSPLPGTISIEYNDEKENDLIVPKHLIVATGAKPREIAKIPIDHEYILTSDDLVHMEVLPKSIVIVGGGVIGIEWATMLHDVGVEVTIVEADDIILPTKDIDIQKSMHQSLVKRGITIHTRQQVENVVVEQNEVRITLADHMLIAERVVFAIGRQGNSENIGLENTEVIVENSFIQVNEHFQTNEAHIFAVGDVIGGVQLAHVASEEAMQAVEYIAGKKKKITQAIPKCIYSFPEVAAIGLTEQQAKQQFAQIRVEKFPFQANAKALINEQTEGFIKCIVDEQTDDLVGIHLIGEHVTELIGTFSLAFTLDASSWEVAKTIFPHPSVSEVMKEVTLAIERRAIHF